MKAKANAHSGIRIHAKIKHESNLLLSKIGGRNNTNCKCRCTDLMKHAAQCLN
jgi:hypothetical protein